MYSPLKSLPSFCCPKTSDDRHFFPNPPVNTTSERGFENEKQRQSRIQCTLKMIVSTCFYHWRTLVPHFRALSQYLLPPSLHHHITNSSSTTALSADIVRFE